MNKTEIGLKRPFRASQLRWRKGPGGKELVYITARDAMDRLDQVLGIEGWDTRFHECAGRVVCELEMNINGKLVVKSDGAGDTSIEGEKGAMSDAFKRACSMAGVARYLYNPSAFNGRTPAEWATPEGYDKIMAKRHNKEIEQFRKELGNV